MRFSTITISVLYALISQGNIASALPSNQYTGSNSHIYGRSAADALEAREPAPEPNSFEEYSVEARSEDAYSAIQKRGLPPFPDNEAKWAALFIACGVGAWKGGRFVWSKAPKTWKDATSACIAGGINRVFGTSVTAQEVQTEAHSAADHIEHGMENAHEMV